MREFTVEELELLNKHEITPEEADAVLTMFPQNLDTAIGHIVGLRAGRGQTSVEPAVTEVEAGMNAPVDPTIETPTAE